MWRKLWRRHWQGLLIEMFAVFIGVSAAFALDNYRENKERAEKRQQFIELMQRDLQLLKTEVQRSKGAFDSGPPGEWLAAYEAGKMPPLMAVLIPEANRSQVWLVLLQSGAAQTLDIQLLAQVEAYLLENELLVSQLRQYNALVMSQLMPKLEADPTSFYHTENGKLRSSFIWYLRFLKEFKTSIGALEQSTLQLEQSLEQAKRP